MEIKNLNFRDHLFAIILISAIVLVVLISYNKFIANHDYLVSYEGECDHLAQQCFIGCEDDECEEVYYYSRVQKYAQDLYTQCGNDITDCQYANHCALGDRKCSVIFCNTEIDGEGSCSIPPKKADVTQIEEQSSRDLKLESNQLKNNL